MRLIDGDALKDNLETAIAVYKRNAKYDKTLLRQVEALKLELKIIKDAPTIEPKVSGKMIDADAFAEAIENLDWYSLHNGKMIQGAEGSDNAYYKASDIYTEINKAVTIRVDLIEPKCADGCIYGWGSDECEKCRFKCEQKRGRWINKKSADWAGGGATLCSCCDYGYSWGGFFEVENFNYCPNCGARMEASDD